MHDKITIIAEVIPRSSYGYAARNEWEELFAIAEGVGDMVCVHADGKRGGAPELVRKARNLTSKPIVARGCTDSEIRNAIGAGADFVIVNKGMPKNPEGKCWLELSELEMLQGMPSDTRIVWGSDETFDFARESWKGWICQAGSGIKTVMDIKSDADAVLVGAHLEEFAGSMQ